MSDSDDKSFIIRDLSAYWEIDSPNYYESLVWLIAEFAGIAYFNFGCNLKAINNPQEIKSKPINI